MSEVTLYPLLPDPRFICIQRLAGPEHKGLRCIDPLHHATPPSSPNSQALHATGKREGNNLKHGFQLDNGKVMSRFWT
jgi:hypothetical protein